MVPADLSHLVPQVLPMLQWPDIHLVCLSCRACSQEMVKAIHHRYLLKKPGGVRSHLEKLGKMLDGAQAAQAKGHPESLTLAAAEMSMLEQSSQVLARNCQFYADLFERVGTCVGDDLERYVDDLLDCIERVQAFADAVTRLREAAEARPLSGPSCRDHTPADV
eukprot:gnl/TRDRNA2_/TRDRNA2_191551_c0_seq1.p1 gnl/TRDRNA2_/TRDRNA2_191551_c0~~gnl/TRDRNA2_/TRDRNA2_191551_c0_seq1.p1  ORF type:complete len:176 (+),score=24.94 gnl/TRDRNA2_/TRDRNA2_191551_c0_seq1:38-529(+)